MTNTLKLRKVLLGNATFSLTSGLLMILLNSVFTEAFGLDNGLVFYIVGAGLLAFGLNIIYVAIRKIENRKQVLGVSIADFAWVLGSAFIVFTSAFELTILGYEIISAVAFIVLLFGILQLKFNR